MFTRSAAPGGLFITTVLACLLAATAAATEWHIGAGGSGSNYFATLEEFREAMAAGLINMADGDAILLYRDDASLTADLVLPDAWHITIRSVGGQYTISGGSIWSTVDAVGNNPNLTLENVRISSVGYAAINFEAVNSGHLTVSNSAVVDGTIGLNIEGNVTADIINSQFSNNAYINVASVSNYSLESTTLNITMNANADRRTIWSGGSTAISFFGSGNFDINFDVAAGKVLDVQGSIDAANYGFRSMNITKTGAGEVKLRGGSVLWDPDLSDDFYYTYGNFNFVLEEGKVHFTSTGKTDTTWTDFNGSITTKSGTVFKINHTPGTLADIPESDDIVVGEN
ncbi:MAG: hypothetical protein LIP77_10425, partial [Planctomycetes bacterium]|nr:hypothetical protein [Planctomycetota bacterium]